MNVVLNASESLNGQTGFVRSPLPWLILAGDLCDGVVRFSEPDAVFVQLQVRDNGVGMDDAIFVKMFDPFFSTKFLSHPDRSRGKAGKDKINNERLSWFQGEYSQRRKPGDLAKMIASDDSFGGQTLDAYRFAWSITYFITWNPARAGKFAKHLKKISDRNSLHVYSAKERLPDFQEIFGDIARAEVDFVRSLKRLQVD